MDKLVEESVERIQQSSGISTFEQKAGLRDKASQGPKLSRQQASKTCLYMNDRAATTKDKEHLTGPHDLYNTKYGSEELLWMRTKVTTVKGTKEGREQTV